ncbi:methyltransferase domain-containing protein [Ectothiorhodospira shaposhnikovii]|uniref:methyltransferase domain-containing protein n=1 Tax=Ectothiorhodospira shaposhnikovii TaxID=1054 RepID=UPI0019048D89
MSQSLFQRLKPATPTLTALSHWHQPQWRPSFTSLLLDRRVDLVYVPMPAPWNLDLIRVAALLGYPVLVDLTASLVRLLEGPQASLLTDALGYVHALRPADDAVVDGIARVIPDLGPRLLPPALSFQAACERAMEQVPEGRGQDYAAYEFGLRDQGMLEHIQMPHVAHFKQCRRVLDVACGPGIFLQLLAGKGITGEGVERNEAAVRYARGLGLTVHQADAVEFLEQTTERYDGLYCSHFIEHLPVSAAERLIQGAARVLSPGGMLVLTFPDPESIRSQLLGFWRDPEHVRFYHPELVALMARGAGLEVLSGGQGRAVPRFDPEPPGFPSMPAPSVEPAGMIRPDGRIRRLWRWGLRRLGICPGRDVVERLERAEAHARRLERCLERQLEAQQALRQGLDSLWAVNRTWAWEDNACLVLRKPEEG